MGLAKIQITAQFLENIHINAKLFGQIFLNLPEGTVITKIQDTGSSIEFCVAHEAFKGGGEITAMFNRTVYRSPADDYAYKYIDQLIGLNFDHALEKL